jgi:voltage-dependent anion channel protein 2
MAFVPPFFKDFGKKAKDLLSKKYDYQNKLTAKNNVQSDLTIESSTTSDEKGNWSGAVKATYKDKAFGQVETEVDTAGKASVEVKAQKLVTNTSVNVKATQKQDARISAEYTQDNLSAIAGIDASKNGSSADLEVAAGLDGFAVGANGKYDFTKSEVNTYNAGAEYSAKDFTASVKTDKKFEAVLGSYYHNVSTGRAGKTQVGGQFSHDFNKKASVLTIGTEHDVDAATTLKAKVDSEGAVAGAVEHRLANPAVKINAAAAFNKNTGFAAQSFGVGFTFGDF